MKLEYLNVKKIELGSTTVHCVQAPESGEWVNAQLIETPNKLLLVDTLQLVPHANELRQYIESLGKPLEKILITHHHPDHWFGAASFEGYRMEALPETIGIINALADFVLDYHRKLHPDDPEVIPDRKVVPTIEAQEGTFDFDGEKINLIKILDTECPCNMVLELPEHKTLLSQDLIYNGAYPYFGEKTSTGELSVDNWIGVLKSFQEKNYERIIPGHGDPTTPAIIPTMIGYLEFVKAQLAKGLQGDELIDSIKKKYPDYKLELTLIMSNYMLFEYQP
ncbi:MBL fold metallo-hydrolase [Persicitalea sp.]|uniref:MBL fold metallo-hydrolase n=1 Tax=Persicitalea sp. TaxID=3100273 RepID=UPI00359336DE